MGDTPALHVLLRAIAVRDHHAALARLTEAPTLATTTLARRDECFLEERSVPLYQGDTALHAAAFSYDPAMALALLDRGADIRARNRRGAEPLHAAVLGNPVSPTWNPAEQAAVIRFLVGSGADPDAPASGGVTPLHRAVRNRCSAAVEALLRAGADPHLPNDHGSTALDLARVTSGRGGSGSDQARAEQRIILDLLTTGAP
jgi:hypothetical protein